MNAALLAASVAVCGGLGAASRLVVDAAVSARWHHRVPATGTLLVNVVGSLVAGIVTGCVLAHGLAGPARTIVVTGFCGGLTTWSTATYETVRIAESGRRVLAFVFGAGGVALSVAAAAVGLAVVGA